MLLVIVSEAFFTLEEIDHYMDDLQKKYDDYMRLIGCTVQYKLVDGTEISFVYKEENFAHLLGLHKLVDIQLIQFWLDRSNRTVKLPEVIRRIKKGTFTDAMVRQSVFFSQIEDRYNNFTYDNLTTLNYTDAVVDFNPSIMKSKIKSDYVLFEKKITNSYNHMGIAKNVKSGERYVETFFNNKTDCYIRNQKIVAVKSFKLIDTKGNIIVEDSF